MASEIVQIYRNEPDGSTTDIYPRTIASAVYITAKQTLEDYIKGEGGADITANLKVFGDSENMFIDNDGKTVTRNQGIVPSFSTTQASDETDSPTTFLNAKGEWYNLKQYGKLNKTVSGTGTSQHTTYHKGLVPEYNETSSLASNSYLSGDGWRSFQEQVNKSIALPPIQYHVASLQACVNDGQENYGVLWFKNLTNLSGYETTDSNFSVPYIVPYEVCDDDSDDKYISACFVTHSSTGYQSQYKLKGLGISLWSKSTPGTAGQWIYRTETTTINMPRGIGINIKLFDVKTGDKVIVAAYNVATAFQTGSYNDRYLQDRYSAVALSVSTLGKNDSQDILSSTANAVYANQQTQGCQSVDLTDSSIKVDSNGKSSAWISIRELDCYGSSDNYSKSTGMNVIFDIYVIRK